MSKKRNTSGSRSRPKTTETNVALRSADGQTVAPEQLPLVDVQELRAEHRSVQRLAKDPLAVFVQGDGSIVRFRERLKSYLRHGKAQEPLYDDLDRAHTDEQCFSNVIQFLSKKGFLCSNSRSNERQKLESAAIESFVPLRIRPSNRSGYSIDDEGESLRPAAAVALPVRRKGARQSSEVASKRKQTKKLPVKRPSWCLPKGGSPETQRKIIRAIQKLKDKRNISIGDKEKPFRVVGVGEKALSKWFLAAKRAKWLLKHGVTKGVTYSVTRKFPKTEI